MSPLDQFTPQIPWSCWAPLGPRRKQERKETGRDYKKQWKEVAVSPTMDFLCPLKPRPLETEPRSPGSPSGPVLLLPHGARSQAHRHTGGRVPSPATPFFRRKQDRRLINIRKVTEHVNTQIRDKYYRCLKVWICSLRKGKKGSGGTQWAALEGWAGKPMASEYPE